MLDRFFYHIPVFSRVANNNRTAYPLANKSNALRDDETGIGAHDEARFACLRLTPLHMRKWDHRPLAMQWVGTLRYDQPNPEATGQHWAWE